MIATIFSAAALVLGLALSPAVQADAVLKRGNYQDPSTLDPHRISTVYEANIILDLFEGLVSVDPAGHLSPGVAETWSVSEDGLTWTFDLHAGLVWSDGQPLTAEDVVFSFRRLLDPSTASQYPTLFYGLANAKGVHAGAEPLTALGIEAVDPQRVLIRLENLVPNLPDLLSNGFATIVPKHTIEQYGDDWTKSDLMTSNGAFVLVDWRPQEHVVLAKNPRYRDATNVSIDRVTYLPTEDQTAAVAQFRSGALDISMEFPTARTDWLKENLPDETRVAPQLITFYLTFNTTKPGLSDPRVRQALSLAIDRNTLAQRVLRTGEQAAWTFVPPFVVDYTPPDVSFASQPHGQRLANARSLLSEAGYSESNPLRLSFSLSSAEDRMRVASAITAMWRTLGVQVTLNNTESKVLFSRLRTGDFQIGYAAWAADVNDAANFLGILHSQSRNSNYARYNNPIYDALLDRALRMADPGLRNDLLSQAEALLIEDAPMAPLFYGVSKSLVGQHVKGWIDNPRDVHLSRYLSVSPKNESAN